MRTRDEAIEPDDDERDSQRTVREVHLEIFACCPACCSFGAVHTELVVDDSGERRPTRLLFGGSGVVLRSSSDFDLVLNSVALGFVLQLDEMIYETETAQPQHGLRLAVIALAE